jgi:hypothetical protein
MTPTEMVDLAIKLISNLGFPIFVATYMMIYNTRTLKELKEAIDKLSEAIERIP